MKKVVRAQAMKSGVFRIKAETSARSCIVSSSDKGLRTGGRTVAFARILHEDKDEDQGMRKSQAISLALFAAAAVSLSTGCERPVPTQVRNCVDDQRVIASDDGCDNAPYTGSVVVPGTFRYIYGGASGGHYGDKVVGGSWQPEAGARIVSGDTGAVVHSGSDEYPGSEGIGA